MNPRREFLQVTLTGLASLGLSQRGNGPILERTSPPTIWRGSVRHRYVALTYDDCYLLRRLLDLEALLADYPEFKVTLFPVGVALLNLESQDPGVWRRFLDRGHAIGYHSWDHGGIHVMSPANAVADFDRWMAALTEVAGSRPTVRFARPPFGVLSTSFDELARQRGQVVTMWSTGWGGELESGMNAVRHSRNGDIVLLHIRTQDLATTAEAFKWLRAEGWGAVTLSRLYDDLLRESLESPGCDLGPVPSTPRTCLD